MTEWDELLGRSWPLGMPGLQGQRVLGSKAGVVTVRVARRHHRPVD